MDDSTHRFFFCDKETYTALANQVDVSRGYPHGYPSKAVTLRGLPEVNDLPELEDGRVAVAIHRRRFEPHDEPGLSAAKSAGLIEEVDLATYVCIETNG